MTRHKRDTFQPDKRGKVVFSDTIEAFYQVVSWLKKHQKECKDSECIWCGMMECQYTEPTHRWHDGCAVCEGDSNDKQSRCCDIVCDQPSWS